MELVKLVRREIGAIATVDKIQFAPSLPKTLAVRLASYLTQDC
ncbi:Acetyl-coenzyme A synthetase (EC [uncultured Gammaproteobacteria bacterium]|nr:Acetyl-coenzyme A synthetase (EC [uncultured Gammaproteobacteria bacterium]